MENKASIQLNTATVHTTNQTLQLASIAIPASADVGYVTDTDWLAACKRGERIAQRWLYEKYSGKMLYVCIRYLGSKDDAEDAMHDAFIKVFAHIKNFRGDAAVETWITRIMVNTSINVIRKVARKGIKKDIDKVVLKDDSDQTELIDETTEISAQRVLKLITELPVGYRTVLSMYALDGYSHKEIAKTLGIAEGTSKSQLAKARKMLKNIIEEENE